MITYNLETKIDNIFLLGQNKCHSTGVKKSYVCHIFHLRPKKSCGWGGGVGGLSKNLVKPWA